MKKTDPCKAAIDLLKSQLPASQRVLWDLLRKDIAGPLIEADGYDATDMQSIIDALKFHPNSLVLYAHISPSDDSFIFYIYARVEGVWIIFYCTHGFEKIASPKEASQMVKALIKLATLKEEAENLDDDEDDFDDELDPMDTISAAQLGEYIDACSKAPAMRFAKNFRDRTSVCVKVLAGLGLNDEMANIVGANIESQSSQKWINEVLPVAAKELLSQGKTNKEIAAELGVTATKVKFLTS